MSERPAHPDAFPERAIANSERFQQSLLGALRTRGQYRTDGHYLTVPTSYGEVTVSDYASFEIAEFGSHDEATFNERGRASVY